MPPICSALLLVLLGCGPALAEDAPRLPVTETPAPNSTGTILGRHVTSRDGIDLGLLVDVLIDADGQPRAGLIDVGGFMGVGTKRIAIGWQLLRFTIENGEIHITEALSANDAAAAPEFHDANTASIVTGSAPAPR